MILHFNSTYVKTLYEPLPRFPKQAMVVEGARISYVGSNEGAFARWRQDVSRHVDLGGRAVLPGLHDVHNHVLEASSEVAGTCIFDEEAR